MQRNKLLKSKGFTLIEAVIAIAIVGILGIIISEVLSRSFRSSNKSQLIGSIKQNGQNALNSIGQIVRSADNIVCPTDASAVPTITIVKDGVYKRIFFKDQTSSANGYIAQDNPSPITPSDATNLCNMTTYPEVSSTRVFLTDTDANTGVSVKNPSGNLGGTFQVLPSSGYKSLVIVNFNLMPPINSSNSYDQQLGENGALNFKTTIQIR